MAAGDRNSRNVHRPSRRLSRGEISSVATFFAQWLREGADPRWPVNLEVIPGDPFLTNRALTPITLSVPESALGEVLGSTQDMGVSPGPIVAAGGQTASATASPRPCRRLNTLGHFELFYNDELQDLRTRNRGKGDRMSALELLAYVAHMQHRPVPRLMLLDHLWPMLSDEGHQNRNLRHALSTVTEWLYPDHVHQNGMSVLVRNGSGGMVYVNPNLQLDVDADQFERLARTVLRTVAGPSLSPDTASSCQRALDMYHAGYMAGAPFASIHVYEDGSEAPWWKERHDTLQAMACDLQHRLASHWATQGDFGRAVDLLYATLRLDGIPFEPLQRAAQALAKLLARLGRVAELATLRQSMSDQHEIMI